MPELKASFKLEELYGKCNYSVQYVDYGPDQWTVPVTLLRNRAEQFLSDLSVKKVRLIFGNTVIELDLI